MALHLTEEEYKSITGESVPTEVLAAKASKWKNTKVEMDGIKFDSIMEFDRYVELKMMVRLGHISDLKRPTIADGYELIPAFTDATGKKIRATKYVPDFTYINNETGKLVIEDVKGKSVNKRTGKVTTTETPEFKIKQKLLAYRYRDLGLSISVHYVSGASKSSEWRNVNMMGEKPKTKKGWRGRGGYKKRRF